MWQVEVSFVCLHIAKHSYKESPGLNPTGKGQAVSMVLRASCGQRGHWGPNQCRQVARGREAMVWNGFCVVWHLGTAALFYGNQVNFASSDQAWSQLEDFHWLRTWFYYSVVGNLNPWAWVWRNIASLFPINYINFNSYPGVSEMVLFFTSNPSSRTGLSFQDLTHDQLLEEHPTGLSGLATLMAEVPTVVSLGSFQLRLSATSMLCLEP